MFENTGGGFWLSQGSQPASQQQPGSTRSGAPGGPGGRKSIGSSQRSVYSKQGVIHLTTHILKECHDQGFLSSGMLVVPTAAQDFQFCGVIIVGEMKPTDAGDGADGAGDGDTETESDMATGSIVDGTGQIACQIPLGEVWQKNLYKHSLGNGQFSFYGFPSISTISTSSTGSVCLTVVAFHKVSDAAAVAHGVEAAEGWKQLLACDSVIKIREGGKVENVEKVDGENGHPKLDPNCHPDSGPSPGPHLSAELEALLDSVADLKDNRNEQKMCRRLLELIGKSGAPGIGVQASTLATKLGTKLQQVQHTIDVLCEAGIVMNTTGTFYDIV